MTRSLGSAARLALTLTVALALAPTLVACDAATTGGAAGGGTTAPRLTNMKLSPVAVPVGQTTVISGTVEFEDGDGNLTTLVLRFLNPDGTRTPDTDIPVQGVAGTTAGTLTLPDITVEPTEAGEYMLEALARDADGQESSVVSVKVTAQDTSNVHDVCAATGKDCTGQGVCYNLDHVACDYLDDDAFDYPECDDLTGGKKAICVSSVEDPDSYAFESSQCALTQWWSNPTRLEVDCRCGTSEIKHDACKRPYSLDVSVTWGLGPRFKDIQGTTDLRQGPLVGREWFIPMIWNTGTKQDQTMIFAVDIDTGDRRHFSGAYSDPQLGYTTVGEGPAFLEINHVVQGPDGKLYAAGGKEQQSEPRIWRIDPQTGDREVIYDALDTDTYTLCDNGSLAAGRKTVQLTSGNFAMDAKGDFYFATVSANQPGAAIVRLDGQTWACEYLTAVVKGGSLSCWATSSTRSVTRPSSRSIWPPETASSSRTPSRSGASGPDRTTPRAWGTTGRSGTPTTTSSGRSAARAPRWPSRSTP